MARSSLEPGRPGQMYGSHVTRVRTGAIERARAMLRCSGGQLPWLTQAIEAAAVYHDLGKLDPAIQEALSLGRGARLEWDHVDAGVAHLSAQRNWMAAWLVRAHHRPGLPSNPEHFATSTDRMLRGRRGDEPKARHDQQIKRTDRFLDQYLSAHNTIVGPDSVPKQRPRHGLTMRLALSCLVDADHADSALFDGYPPAPEIMTRWPERLAALVAYAGTLPEGQSQAERERNRRRREFFEACLRSEVDDPICACEGAVGIGKTTAVSAYLIRRACDEGLRRLIVVAPYTNILSQTARYLRKALVLPGEQPDHVVVEHHHRADFASRQDRDLAVLWSAPIVLTTAVSFFETLAACEPGMLRKLHAVPGSAVFIDEAHAILPARLWRQAWCWLRELAEDWGCRVVLASGSLARFWENPDVVDHCLELKELTPRKQSLEILEQERHRIQYRQAAEGRALTTQELITIVSNSPGPRLIVVNTVQSAAVVAQTMRQSGLNVLHLSTALTPKDRERVLRRVRLRLRSGCGVNSDWTLVATSCVEAGVDLSFRSAFRERFAVASLIQVGGRVNRNGEYCHIGGGTVHDFALSDSGITSHPGARVGADVLRDFMASDALNTRSPADVVTDAMREEVVRRGGTQQDELSLAERIRDYPAVQHAGRVIEADTRFVVVDRQLMERLERRMPVSWKDLMEGSVQIWASRIEQLGLRQLSTRKDVYAWELDYDPYFLGYMSGVLSSAEDTRDFSPWII